MNTGLNERDINRLNYLFSSICSDPKLYKSFIKVIMNDSNEDYFNIICADLLDHIETYGIKNTIEIFINRDSPFKQIGYYLRMAFLSYGQKDVF